ncbi:hydrocephalus-inducing protein homolog [Ammospiza nelsoni]|uniref:hydrocephalus-inducing protein homolog n=1 Tax=Ammospiza nelsoni TaxID=2857394 RepID=UPI002869BADB|nr:hydrocephalus-inducing protein homolog [Ammospiza nelsoni]
MSVPRTCSSLIPACTITEHKLLRPWAFPVVEEQPGAAAEALATSSAASGPGSEPSPLCPGTEGAPGLEQAGTERGHGQIEGATRQDRRGTEAPPALPWPGPSLPGYPCPPPLCAAVTRLPQTRPQSLGRPCDASVPGAGSGCSFKRRHSATRQANCSHNRALSESALGKGPRRDVTRARTGLLSSCFHKWQSHHFLSLLQIARMVKVSMESSPYFQLACPSDVYHIVPPGASAPVRIRFTPDENKNYSHELTCITAKEKIVVPIEAIGARAILDFPAQVEFSECPVKHTTQKILLVRNVGNRTAHYQLSTERPFSVVPTSGILRAGDIAQVTVTFHALTNGDHFGSLAVCCNTGEESIQIKLHGDAVELDVVLSTNSVEAGKTFITKSYQTTVVIKNRSNITAHFQWKALPTDEDDNEEKRRQSLFLHPSDEDWLENFMEEKEVEKEVGFCEDHTTLLRSRVQEKKAKVQEDPLLFSSDIFFIEPMEGEIGPHCSAKIKVTFQPLEALEYRSVAYCNISGREMRLPLRLRGQGQGPLVEFSIPTLNLGNVFVYTPYVYEVELINQGALDAPFTYIPSTTEVDFHFKIKPERGIIPAGGTQTVRVSFDATVLGSFEKEFQFSVAGSPTPVILTIKGSVTGPDLYFDVPDLDFGDVSFGFPCTKSICLTNNSVVPVMFKLRMSEDGMQPAVSSFDQIRKEEGFCYSETLLYTWTSRRIEAKSSLKNWRISHVTLCSNTVTRFKRRLLVDLQGIAKEVATVFIIARCVVPELNVFPIILPYRECLLKVPYERKLFVTNSTSLPGCYGLIPQKRKEDSPVLYSSPKPCGIVQPYSTAEIPVTIEVQTVGEHRTNILVGVFGDARHPRLSKSYCFVVEPREGVIPARGEVPVTVTATLDDTVGFEDSVQLFIRNSLWSTVFLQAFGIGTTIVIDEPFAPELNLGYQFSLVPCIRQFKVTNKGRRYHQLFWSAECYSPPEEEAQSVSALSSPEDDSQKPKRAKPAFGVKSPAMGLARGQSEDMVLRGFSRIPQEVQDYVFCEAITGTASKMERIIETIITCEFIHPSIEVSAREFSFYVEKKPSDVLRLQYQPLSLENTCLLPLDLMLDLEQPFQVCDEEQQPLPGGQPVRVDVGETCHLYIMFDPAYELDFKSWKEEKVLKIDMVRGHPFVERISLQGEVHFPNLQMQPSSLEFGCIRVGTEEVRFLEITNCSPLPVQYHWSFQSDSEVTRFRDELYPPKFKPQPPKGKATYLDHPASRWRHFKMRYEETARMLSTMQDFNQSLRDKVQAEQIPEYPRLQVGFEGVSCSVDTPQTSLEAQEAFSILPVSGVLQPGESQQVSFTFCGHLNTISDVTALCHVEGGPTYEVMLTGEISHLSYLVRPQEINRGLQMFNEIHHSNVTLVNGGKIELNWVLNPSPADKHLPGVFLVNPTTGSLAPGKKQVLKFSYMPGLPGAFSRTYQLKVGDLEPENICLKGEASFPMISLDLPWNIRGNEKYEKTLKRLIKRRQIFDPSYKSVVLKKPQSPKTETLKIRDLQPSVIASGTVSDTQLQIKMMRMLIEKPFVELQQILPSHPLKSRFPDKELCQSLVKVELLEYVLDMGPVLKGYTESRSLKITNPGQIHVSFQVDVSVLQDTGFSVGLDQMICLPPNNSVDFDVRFESAHKPYGDVEVVLPIEVTEGPMYSIRIRATVLELSLTLSKNRLQFSDILVGDCQVETIRLFNWFRVPCKWFIASKEPALRNNQHEPCPFDVTPSKGTLDPGKWQNLHIQFTPEEERSYKNELELIICGSSNHLKLHLSGQGLEPRLEFRPPALKMGWMLVDSDGVEATVVVKNPCNFPIEFYSLDFDEQYLEEEKILRMAVGSEYQKRFFLPPRAVGETLPPEVLQDHEAQRRPKAQEAELKARAEAKAMGNAAAARHRAVPFCLESMVKEAGNPVSRAVLRHLGIDPDSESCEAQPHQGGMVVIIHGPPRAGKTEIAAGLCQYYDAAYVSIDTVVKEAMAKDGSPAGLRARELCTQAALELEGKDEGDADKKSQTKNKRASGEKINKNVKEKTPPSQKKESASRLGKPDIKFTVSTAPAPQQLNIVSSRGEELNCLSCVLPEELLVDILSERLQRKDCSKGVIFDGLESLFASSLESSLLCVLKAVKNRCHIFMVNLHEDYDSWKTREEAERKRKEAETEKEALQRKAEHILQIDEDEYDALPEEKKAEMDKIILERKRIRRKKELKQLAQKLQEEAKALERWKEEKKGVSMQKQPPKPAKEETRSPEGKEAPEKGETKAPETGETKAPEKWETKAAGMGETEIPEDQAEIENLILRFQIYDSSQQNVAQVFSCWDRVQGTVQLPVIQKGKSPAENKGQKTNRPQEKVEKKPEQKSGDQRSLQSSQLGTRSEAAEGAVGDEHIGVPCLDIEVSDPKAMIGQILRDGKLPTEDQLLKHLGLHPDGPPLPPAAVLSIVEYPEERLGSAERVEPFSIVAPEGAAIEEDLPKAPDVKGSSSKGHPKTGKATSRDSSAKEKHISTQRAESPRDSSATGSKSTVGSASVPTEFLRLKRYRWIVPAHGEVELKVNFSAKKPGRFEQTLRFELVQSKRQYELPCCGTGLYPSISQNPRVVFPQCRKTMKEDEVIFKEYVESTKQFHFGPLLCGKSREWYKALNCPGNSEHITILNNSPMDIEVHFSFENDGEAETFLLDPPSLTLKPKEKQELTIWAYPTSLGFLEDKLICSIEKNPEPVVFSLCCYGVHVKLEISPPELSFDKLLLHRTDSRTLVLKNNSLLPMAWQLNGLDYLAENFSLSQDNGILDPSSELEVTVHFKAEQIGIIEKILRLEVSDIENVLGVVHTENIEISAEVYDASLTIDFIPEGPEGSLEFGTINVMDNVKKVLSLNNRGVYNIEYRFTLKGAGPRMRDAASHFTVAPQSGVLIASQPAVNVEMLFHPTSEMLLKNRPILYCQVTDARLGRGGQVVADIPLKVSAKAVYSKYSIEPASPINFGAMIKGTKKSQTVVLENKGMLHFKFCIRQPPEDASTSERKSSKEGESAPLAARLSPARKSSSFTQSHLNLGMFTVSPCSGSIGPWGQQKITVDCFAGQEGKCEEQLYIDIPGRDPKENPLGVPFTLIAESCLPGLAEDVLLIFEEYPICSSTDLDRKMQSVKGTGLFVRDDNRFIFNKVLVGQEAEAHFSIYSASSLPCDVVLSIKPLPGEEQFPINNVFKLDPVKMSIPGSSYAVATVTFTPPDDQNYNCTFKASLVIPKGPVKIKPQTVTFTISGKAHEAQLTVVCPSARSKRGTAVLRFKRRRVGTSQKLPLVVRNDGILPLKFMLCLEHEYGAFFLKGRASTLEVFHTEDEDSIINGSKPTKPFFLLHHGESAEFDVIFKPTLAQRLEGEIRLLLADACSNKILVELVGEGHRDRFYFRGLKADTEERDAKSSLNKDIIDAIRVNHLDFGHCPVGKCCRRTFTIRNRTQHQFLRFEWEADGPFHISPKVGHLRPRRSKKIRVTFKSNVPVTYRRHLVKCKVTKIEFQLPPRKVPDWDDRNCIVTWKSTPRKDPGDKFYKMQKVVEPVPETDHIEVEGSTQEAEVCLSASVAYTQLKTNTIVVQFKDTLPFHTRTATFRIHNTGKVPLEYYWEEPAASKPVKKGYSVTLMHLTDETPAALFSIDPYRGTLAPGQMQTFHVRFFPKAVGRFKTIMVCRIPKLRPSQKKVRLILRGRARDKKKMRFGKPKRSALRQAEESPKPKKRVHWKLPPE